MDQNLFKEEEGGLQFPIFSFEEYDFHFGDLPVPPGEPTYSGLVRGNVPWPLGLKSTYPAELIRRIGAAVVSYQMGYQAIDHVYKKYFKGFQFRMDDGSRLDLQISRAIREHMKSLTDVIGDITKLDAKKQGQIISEWTFLRVPFGIEFLLSCANKGVLYESIAVARMLLEQIAWAAKINRYEHYALIRQTSATRAVGGLNAAVPTAGALYGWLSVHAHWAYDGHIKAFHFEEGKLGTLFATKKFKARMMTLAVLMSVIATRTFVYIKEREVKDGSNQRLNLKERLSDAPLFRIMEMLMAYDPNDDDIQALARMMPPAIA